MPMRIRTTGALAGLFAGALLMAGWGQAAAAVEGPGSSAAAKPAAEHDVSASNCSARDFTIDLTPQPDRPGEYLMAMTNTSQKTCGLGGWVNLVPQNMAGEPITQVPVDTVEHPGAPVDIELAPGRTAFAGVHAELGDKADPKTYVASGFTAKPADMHGQVDAKVTGTEGQPVQIPLTSMKIGTLQPSPTGVQF